MAKRGGGRRRFGSRIEKFTKAYIRTYSDTGQVKAYVEWIDDFGNRGRTEGNPDGTHMQALLKRARHEGVPTIKEVW